MTKYIKEVFDVVTLAQAKNVVLSDDPSNPNKFEYETQFLINTIKEFGVLKEQDTILDFGCGMGRVSKELVHQLNLNVIGVDISDSMLTFAKLYVCKPKQFSTFNSYDIPESVDAVVSTFVLQHTEYPDKEIENLAIVLRSGGYLILVNEHNRFVPSDVDKDAFVIWHDDKFDVFTEIEKHLVKVKSVPYLNSQTEVVLYKKP